MIGTIHIGGRHHKPLDTLITKIHKAKIKRNIREKIYNHRQISISLRIFCQMQKKE